MPNRRIHQGSLLNLCNPPLPLLLHHFPQSAELPPSRLNSQDVLPLLKVQVSWRLRYVVHLRILLRTNVHHRHCKYPCLSNCY
jgi:hypothetical protein